MGQYHIATITNDKHEVCYATCAGKLCESPFNCDTSANVFNALSPKGAFHKHRLFWAGDCAEPLEGMDKNVYEIAKGVLDEKYEEFKQFNVPFGVVFNDDCRISPEYRYAVNYDKHQFVDLTKTPMAQIEGWEFMWNPLAVLCTSSNMTGGGDYDRKACYELVGTWTGDHIGVESSVPDGFEEILAQFTDESEPLMTRSTVVNLLYKQFPDDKMNDSWDFVDDYFDHKYQHPDPHWFDTKEQVLEAFNKWRNRTIQYHRNPTDAEIKFGEGATHYIDVPVKECMNDKGKPKKWLVINGLRYYR